MTLTFELDLDEPTCHQRTQVDTHTSDRLLYSATKVEYARATCVLHVSLFVTRSYQSRRDRVELVLHVKLISGTSHNTSTATGNTVRLAYSHNWFRDSDIFVNGNWN